MSVVFIDIKNETMFSFNSWDEIKKMGGVCDLFSPENYKYIYNVDACKETIILNRFKHRPIDLSEYYKCIEIYNKKINNDKI